MGTIDSTIHKLTCENCGITEEQRVRDSGSGWGGSHWDSSADFWNFKTSWSGDGGKKEPSITEAVCKQCGRPAQHEQRFGG